MGQKCHFNPLSDFFWFSLVGGRQFSSQHCSALFRAAVICAVSFDTDGYFKPLTPRGGRKRNLLPVTAAMQLHKPLLICQKFTFQMSLKSKGGLFDSGTLFGNGEKK